MKHSRDSWRVLLAVLLACCISSIASASSVQTSPLIKQPYLQAPTTTSMEVRWEAAGQTPGAVEWGRSADALNNTTPAKVESLEVEEAIEQPLTPGGVAYLQRATLTGLEPGVRYWYRVHQGSLRTDTFNFRTIPKHLTKFRFVAYGDNRSFPQDHHKVAMGIVSAQPAFFFNTGDLVAYGDDWPLWSQEFFGPLHPLIAQVPVWVVRGNHEGSAKYVRELFHLPGPEGRFYYRFDYGPARFICLDGNLGRSRPGMFAWMEQQLRESPKPLWNFVLLHYPSFNAASKRAYGPGYERERMALLCQRYGIDVVFTGHDHDYMRTVPILGDRAVPGNPTTHVVTGGGGAPTYTLGHSTWMAVGASVHHYCVVDIDGLELRMMVYDADQGAVIDRFHLEKDAQSKVIAPADYRRRAHTVSYINAIEGLRRGLTAFRLPALEAGQRVELSSLVSNAFAGTVKVTVSFKGPSRYWSPLPRPVTIVLPAKANDVPFKMVVTARRAMSDLYDVGHMVVEYKLPDGRQGTMRGEGIRVLEGY